MNSLSVMIAGIALALTLAGCGSSGGNNAPTAADDTASTVPDTPVTVDVIGNDTDADGTIDPATVTLASGPGNGTASVNAVTGAVTYTPNAGFTGTDTVTYTVADNDGVTSNAATLTVTVTTSPDLMSLVQQLLVIDANAAPTDVNSLNLQNQFDAGNPMPVAAFLP